MSSNSEQSPTTIFTRTFFDPMDDVPGISDSLSFVNNSNNNEKDRFNSKGTKDIPSYCTKNNDYIGNFEIASCADNPSESPLFQFLQNKQHHHHQQQQQQQQQGQEQREEDLRNLIDLNIEAGDELIELQIDDLFPCNLDITSMHSAPNMMYPRDQHSSMTSFGESMTSFATEDPGLDFNNARISTFDGHQNFAISSSFVEKNQNRIQEATTSNSLSTRHYDFNQQSHYFDNGGEDIKETTFTAGGGGVATRTKKNRPNYLSAGQLTFMGNKGSSVVRRKNVTSTKYSCTNNKVLRSCKYSGVSITDITTNSNCSGGIDKVGMKKSSYLKLLESGALSETRRVRIKGPSKIKSKSTSNLR